MKVILLKDVPALGEAGAVKDVKEGYARNYLIPRGLAAEATERNLRVLEGRQKAVADRAQRERTESERLLSGLETAVIEIAARGGEGGRLFGSVTAQDIADALVRAGFEVGKKQIDLEEPLKTAGFYKVPVRVGPGMVARVDVNVVTTK
ncbi:MAG TPA: 50S ribosomal protein L9 [bacterium]|nr:50S ribosomal protein L9 [bacterium]